MRMQITVQHSREEASQGKAEQQASRTLPGPALRLRCINSSKPLVRGSVRP